MTQLTDKQLETLLKIGYNVPTDTKTVMLDKQVLFSLLRKVFIYGVKSKGNV